MLRLVLLASTLTLLSLTSVQAQGANASEQALFERLVVAEAGGEGVLGQALVARSVLNRTSLLRSRTLSTGTYLARGRTLSGVINGRMQYEPVSSGTINRPRSAAQMRRAREAIALARDTDALRAALRREGRSDAQINNLLRATGFRTRGAYSDPSQNFDRTNFGNHVFNTDRFSRRQDVVGAFDRYYRQGRDQTRRELSAPAPERGRGGMPAEEPTGQDSTGLAGAIHGTTASGRAEAEANAAAGQGSATPSGAPASGSPATQEALATERDLREGGELQEGAAAPQGEDLEAAKAKAKAKEAQRQAETPAEAWQRGLQESEDAWKNGVSDEEIPFAERVEPLAPAPYDDETPTMPRVSGPESTGPTSAPSAAGTGELSAAGTGELSAPGAPGSTAGAPAQSPLAQAATELLTAIVRRAIGGAEEGSGEQAGAASEDPANPTAPASQAPSAPPLPTLPSAESATPESPAATPPGAEAPAEESSTGEDAPGAAGAVAPPEVEAEPSAAPSDADRRAFARFTQRFGRLRLGAQGPMVKRLQSKIVARQTGFFGMATQENLKAWQRSRRLAPSGEVDLATFLALRTPRAAQARRSGTPRVSGSQGGQREAGRAVSAPGARPGTPRP